MSETTDKIVKDILESYREDQLDVYKRQGVRRKIISKHCVAAPVRRDRQRKNKRHLAF